jgi:hypothetical protein
MWIFTKPRSENDNRFVVNLDMCSRINLSRLGEHRFIEVMLESESVPIASAESREEAKAILSKVFESLKAGEKAFDFNAAPK